jgi:hypothetical protein
MTALGRLLREIGAKYVTEAIAVVAQLNLDLELSGMKIKDLEEMISNPDISKLSRSEANALRLEKEDLERTIKTLRKELERMIVDALNFQNLDLERRRLEGAVDDLGKRLGIGSSMPEIIKVDESELQNIKLEESLVLPSELKIANSQPSITPGMSIELRKLEDNRLESPESFAVV